MGTEVFEELIKARRSKLDVLRTTQKTAYPNDFRVTDTISSLCSLYNSPGTEYTQETLETVNQEAGPRRLAGRIKLHRVMGKTSFAQIVDASGIIQLYLRRSNEEDDGAVPRKQYNAFKKFDLGDIVGVEGFLYRTNKGEFSIRVTQILLLTKSLLPLPDKHHGLIDQEACYRKRYLDLMVNPKSVKVFKFRSDIVSNIRNFMHRWEFVEVETPVLHPMPGGATARPFTTHHNALDMELFMRIAPELYLKRLIVGGFTKVFELNRSFRNEGISPRHNPEFTMMEFYCAYADYQDLMGFIEKLLRHIADPIFNSSIGISQDKWERPFARMTMREAVEKFNPELIGQSLEGRKLAELFEETVEHRLIEPTFITQFPIEVSPLARRNNENPEVADRFELFAGGQEIANGFSELNDPDDQASRFKEQLAAREGGDDEAMHYDEDYIQALQYGMPPTAGAGIGIDRLVMYLLEQSNIRDVIFFPLMRPR